MDDITRGGKVDLPKRPLLIKYFEDKNVENDIDFLAFNKDKKVYMFQKEEAEYIANTISNKKTKRPYMTRKTYRKENPRLSEWYKKYIIDEFNTFKDPEHRDGIQFARRFSHSFDSVKEIVAEISKPEHDFWKKDQNNAGILHVFSVRFIFLCFPHLFYFLCCSINVFITMMNITTKVCYQVQESC